MRRRRSLRLFAFVTLACAVWLGCNAILGNESAEFDPEAAAKLDGSSGGDGTTDGKADGTTNTDGSSGGDGSVDGDVDVDAGPCNGADLMTSGDNCGTCGHSCVGGACTGGKCQPVQIATDEVGPGPIAVDATNVYWINVKTGDVWTVPITGGAKIRMFDGADDTGGRNIIARGGKVYFGIADLDAGVVRCDAPACDAGPTFEVSNIDVPASIAITDAGALYFAETASAGAIYRCQLPCGAGRDTIVPGGGAGFPSNVAVLDTDTYWTTITPFPPRLRRLDGNGTPGPIASGAIDTILPTPTEVFFMEQGEGPSAVAPDGGAVRRLNALLSEGHMVFFGNEILATETNSNYVYTCPLTGCPDGGAKVANANRPRGVAFDATFIYWANEGTAGSGGSIMRLAR